MKNLNSKVCFLVKIAAIMAVIVPFLSACSEEKQEKLADLPPVELPKDVPGLYSGRMPCDDCKTNMIRMTLNDDSTVVVVRKKILDTLITDTLIGTYVYSDSTIKVSLADNSIHWDYVRSAAGNLSYVTSSGTIYEDENGTRAELIRIFKSPVKKVQAPQE